MAKKQTIEETVEELTLETVEVEETVEEVTVEETTPATHTVKHGETLVSISELYRGEESNYSYAKKLKTLNNNKHLTSGTTITLP
jgi:hypothetical protein